MTTRVLSLAGWLLLVTACRGGNPEYLSYTTSTGGDARRGHELIERYECGTCHTIPGVSSAHGVLASPLFWFAQRSFVAGELPNTPENLVRWIQDPRAIEPRTAMPAVGLSEAQARDVAAYLYTLR